MKRDWDTTPRQVPGFQMLHYYVCSKRHNFLRDALSFVWATAKGPHEGAVQVLVYFAVAKKGEMPVDGKTDLNPDGLTAAWGLHAKVIAERLRQNGLSCSTPDRPQFMRAMLEKLIWIRYHTHGFES
jgi:hypothetical protein